MSTISDIAVMMFGMEDIEPTFAERIEGWRLAAGLLQEELAEKLGVTQSTVSSWENGSRPGRLTCYRIADFFGHSRRDVIVWAGHRPRPADLRTPEPSDDQPRAPRPVTLADRARDSGVLFQFRRKGISDEDIQAVMEILDGIPAEGE